MPNEQEQRTFQPEIPEDAIEILMHVVKQVDMKHDYHVAVQVAEATLKAVCLERKAKSEGEDDAGSTG